MKSAVIVGKSYTKSINICHTSRGFKSRMGIVHITFNQSILDLINFHQQKLPTSKKNQPAIINPQDRE